MPRRLHSYHRFFRRRRSDALKKDRYIKGSAIFCTGASCYALYSSLEDHKQRLQIKEFLGVNRQLIHWCNWISKTFVEAEQKTAKRHAFVEEGLIKLGVLKGWELLEAEEDEGSSDEVEESCVDEGGMMPTDPSKRVKAQNNEDKQTNMDGNSASGEGEYFDVVESFEDGENMEHQNADAKRGSASWFGGLLSLFTSTEESKEQR